MWLDNKFYGQILSLQYKKGNDQLIVGGGWTRYEGGHYGNVIWAQNGGFTPNYVWYSNNALKTDENIYAKWEHQLTNHLLFYADLQYKHVMHRMDGFNADPLRHVKEDWNFFNPKLGISYSKNDWQLYASWAVANKEPNRTDFENATNYTPQPETLNDFELGAEKKTSAYNYGATVYYMDYKDQLVLTGQLDDVGNTIRINTPKSYRLGLELQGGLVLTNWVNLTGNFTISSNKIKQFTEHIYSYDDNYNIVGDSSVAHNNTNISFSPSKIASASINFLPCKHVGISLLSKYVDRQYLDKTLLHDYIFEWQPEGASKCCMALGWVPLYNHSYTSNCEYFMDYDDDTINIKTVRSIPAGEELTINYNGDWDNKDKVWFEVM